MSKLAKPILGLSLGLSSCCLGGCSGVAAETEAAVGDVSSAVVYGRDDRVEPSAAPAEWAALGAESTLALIPGRRLVQSNSGIQVKALSLQQTVGVCPVDPFAEEPTASECSAVLIDDDLVLTAGHCFSADDACDRFAYVFDYAQGQQGIEISAASVFGCRALIRLTNDSAQGQPAPDFAIVQLDRAAGRKPVSLASALPVVGDPLVALGYPSGLPLKIDRGGVVLRTSFPDDQQFTASIDAFQGNSGGPIFDADGGLVGILVAGAPTDYETRGGCQRPRRVDPTPDGGERILRQGAVLAALCGMEYPSERLCGATTQCGDGTCSPGEANGGCSTDCVAPLCTGFDCLGFPEPPAYEMVPENDATTAPTPTPASVPPAAPSPSCRFAPGTDHFLSPLALLLAAGAARARRIHATSVHHRNRRSRKEETK
jgi:V8-like Glu-specific endopeptidase